MTVMSRVLNRIILTDSFTADTRTSLSAKIGSLDSEIFANLNAFGVADKLIELKVEINADQVDEISEYLLAEMKRLEVFQINMQPSSVNPLAVNVNFPKSADEKDLEELLKDINKNTSNLPLRTALLNRPEVISARREANYRPVFAGKDSMLDIDATMASLKWLRDGNPYREQIEGCFLMELNDILDDGQIQYIHPINGNKLPTNMIDELSLDFSLIDKTVYKAYVWFRQECNIGNGGAILSELQRMSSHAIYQDMLSKGKDSITQKVLAKFTHACGSKSGAMIEDISIKWPTQSRDYAAYTSQFQNMFSQAEQSHEKKPIGGELNTAQLRKLFECLSANDTDNLAFDHFPEARRNFTTGQTNGQRISLLIEFAQKQLQVTNLMNAIWKINPNGYDKFMAELNPPQDPSPVKKSAVYNINIGQARGVSIGGSANGSTIITGNGNNNWF